MKGMPCQNCQAASSSVGETYVTREREEWESKQRSEAGEFDHGGCGGQVHHIWANCCQPKRKRRQPLFVSIRTFFFSLDRTWVVVILVRRAPSPNTLGGRSSGRRRGEPFLVNTPPESELGSAFSLSSVECRCHLVRWNAGLRRSPFGPPCYLMTNSLLMKGLV